MEEIRGDIVERFSDCFEGGLSVDFSKNFMLTGEILDYYSGDALGFSAARQMLSV